MTTTHQPWDIVSGIGITALAVAAGRAVETSRPEPLIEDPYAAHFVAAAQPPAPLPTTTEEAASTSNPELWSLMTEYMAVRTRAFDEYLTRAVEDGVRQVVLLAAGLDVRAFRLRWPSELAFFELDQPLVLDFKLRVLREQGATADCAHHPVPIDLRDDWPAALEAAGFDPTLPTAWLAEGLLPYLPPEAEARLFAEIDRLSGPGSQLATEHIADMEATLRDPMMQDGGQMMGIRMEELIHTDRRPEPKDRLVELGWECTSTSADKSAVAYGRPLSPSMFAGRAVHSFARRP